MVLSLITVLGMVLTIVGTWLFGGKLAFLNPPGLAAVYIAGGFPATWRALSTLCREHVLDIDLLMVVAAVAAAVVGASFEGAVLLTLFSISTTLEHRALGRARRAIEALMALRPETALRKGGDGTVEEVAANELAVGDVVVLRPGARVPADGVIVQGRGGIDEANITGESMPVSKEPGEQVFEATVNLDGVLDVSVTRTVGESTIARMIQLVTEAQAAKAPSERFSSWFGQRYTVVVMVGAVVTFAAFYWLGHDWEQALYKAATLLVAASPCAIVISVPAAILSALSAAARGGVLFKGGAALETLAAIDTFAFDKTGTLTEGRPRLTDVVVAGIMPERELLGFAAALEKGSEHPLAEAIVDGAAERGIKVADAGDFEAVTGKGVSGTVAGRKVALGNAAMMGDLRVDTSPVSVRAEGLQSEGKTAMFVAVDGQLAGIVAVADPVKATTAEAIRALHDSGLRIIMATGDNERTASAIASRLGIDEVRAGLLPHEKGELVEQLRSSGAGVAMAGDGVNDAPALAAADVGIAMGTGADVAVESAGITLVKGDLNGIVRARTLARATIGNIRQNLFFAFLYNVLGVPVAAGVLYPLTGTLLSPMLAAAAMSLSSVSVIANALRLRTLKL